MITQEPVSFKKVGLWCLIIALGLISAYIGFLSLVSIWIGFDHAHRAGFWVPILVGISFLMMTFYFYLRTAQSILKSMKEQDVIHM